MPRSFFRRTRSGHVRLVGNFEEEENSYVQPCQPDLLLCSLQLRSNS